MARAPPQQAPDAPLDPDPQAARRFRAPVRVLALLHALHRIEEGHEAAFILARVGKRARLEPAEHAWLVQSAYATLRSRNRLDAAVERAVGEPPAALQPWRRQLLRVAALWGEEGQTLDPLLAWILPHGGPRRAGPVEAEARRAAAAGRKFLGGPEGAGVAATALRTGHPAWFVELARQAMGDETEAFLAANNAEPPLIVRANPLKTSREGLVLALEQAGFRAATTRYSPLGLTVTPKAGVFRTGAFRAGWFEVQDEGSQLVALLLGARAGEWVLDACAGAGGKTLAIGARMEAKGRIIALDTSAQKLLELRRRCGRAGVTNYEGFVLQPDGTIVGSAKGLRRGDAEPRRQLPAERFDRILVDAPCSGLGTLRRNPELRWRQSPERLEHYPQLQRSILDRWGPLLKPGGRLVYATCTIGPKENEEVVRGFLDAHAGFRLQPASEALPGPAAGPELTDAAGFLRLTPHRHGTEGFFAAVLSRAA